MAGARKVETITAPTDPKVPTAAISGGVIGGVVVLLLDLINHVPLDQTALTVVLTAVVSAAVSYGAGWLKSTPFNTLQGRMNAAVVNRVAGQSGPGTPSPPFVDPGVTPDKPAEPPTGGAA